MKGEPLRCARIICTGLLLAVLSWPAVSQSPSSSKTADELFAEARAKAFSGHRKESRELLRLALVRSPGYSEIRNFLARTYAWDGFYDSARTEIRKVFSLAPGNHEAFSVLLDVELWSERYNEAISVADRGLAVFHADGEFMIKKARALKNLGRDQEAVSLLLTPVADDRQKAAIDKLRAGLEEELLTYSVSVSYSVDMFSDVYDPMHLAYVQIGRQTPYGSILARLNAGYRFATSGLQGEMDFYPGIMQGMYAYLNYGYSGVSIFPKHRFGGEVYVSLPASFEVSAGFRYLLFDGGSHVTIYTGSVGWYTGNYYISLRPYLTPDAGDLSKSVTVFVRRYYGDADTYLSVKGSAGFTPDDRTVILSSGGSAIDSYVLKSQSVGIGGQLALSRRFMISATFDYTHQELSFSHGDYVFDKAISVGIKTIL